MANLLILCHWGWLWHMFVYLSDLVVSDLPLIEIPSGHRIWPLTIMRQGIHTRFSRIANSNKF